MRKFLKNVIFILIITVWTPCLAFSADVLFIDNSRSPSPLLTKVEQACEFYGLQLETYLNLDEARSRDLQAYLQKTRPAAIIVTASSLSDAVTKKALDGIRAGTGYRPTLLVADIESSIQQALLADFSFGSVVECASLKEIPRSSWYDVVGGKEITKQLHMQRYETRILEAEILQGGATDGFIPIVRLSSRQNDPGSPVFALLKSGVNETFFLTKFRATDSPYLLRPGIDRGRLLELLPLLMFVRYVFGEHCWHSPGYFANLCIDDPWLRERYGFVRYETLFQEMEKADFHTTIAYVPWNYDRNDPTVVSLFFSHPSRFSLSIHGNNHDHREFSENTSWGEQEKDILQGLARMEAFSRLTGLPYDRIMVFPHYVAAEETLRILKKHNFLATVNADNIPTGAARPDNILFYLRTGTIEYANFLSLRRSSAETETESDIALDLFLDNPILLYSHHDYFKGSPSQFNRLAAIINKLEPSVSWASLATIAKRLYLVRKQTDGGYSVLASCRTIEINNPNDIPATFLLLKPEQDSNSIREVSVNGSRYSYAVISNMLSVTLKAPAFSRSVVSIEYQNDDNIGSVDILKNSLRVSWLRKISDFRDNTLSLLPLGSNLIDLYYHSGLLRRDPKRLVLFLIIIFVVMALIARFMIRRIRNTVLRRRRSMKRASKTP
jgi:hypothetical protein